MTATLTLMAQIRDWALLSWAEHPNEHFTGHCQGCEQVRKIKRSKATQLCEECWNRIVDELRRTGSGVAN